MAKNIVGIAKQPPKKLFGTPQLTYRGGPLIPNVEITAFYWGSAWQNDAIRPKMDAFFDFIVASSLIDQLAEYNVAGFSIGHGSHVQSVIDTSDPPAVLDDSQIQAYIQNQIASGAVPDSNANSLYFVLTPSGVTVSLQGQDSCSQFCGYHDAITSAGPFYAVVPYLDCSGCGFSDNTFDDMTVVASHELCEAITDPVPGSGWYDDANGEIGDICEPQTKVINVARLAGVGPMFNVSVNPSSLLIDGTSPVQVIVTFTPPPIPQPPPPPPPGQSFTVQKEWSNVQGACI